MCVMSMVMDKYNPLIPQPHYPWTPTQPQPWAPWPGTSPDAKPIVTPDPAIEVERVRKLIEDFNEAVKAAEIIDRVTEQPDCVDPEKEKLIERVEELERRIAEIDRQRGAEEVNLTLTLTVEVSECPDDWEVNNVPAMIEEIKYHGPEYAAQATENGHPFTYTVEVKEES